MFLVLFSTHHNGFYIHETVGGSRWFFLVIALIAFSVTISEKRFWSIFSFVFFDLNLQGVPKKRTFRNAINKQPRVNPWPGDRGLTSCSERSGLTSNSESAFFFGTPCILISWAGCLTAGAVLGWSGPGRRSSPALVKRRRRRWARNKTCQWKLFIP